MSNSSSSRRKAAKSRQNRLEELKQRFKPKPGETAWGLLDTHETHPVWMGNERGPTLFNDEMIAKIAARMVDVQLGQPAGQTRECIYDGGANKLKDERKIIRSPLKALRLLERGAVI